MVTQARANPHSLRQRQFAIIVDNFSQALRAMKVTRSGRVVKMQFRQALDPSDRTDLDDARAKTSQLRSGVADVLGAIKARQPIPVGPLTQIVGAPWATYLAALSVFDPKNIPATCGAVAATPKPKKGSKRAAPPPVPAAPADPHCAPPVEAPPALFGIKI